GLGMSISFRQQLPRFTTSRLGPTPGPPWGPVVTTHKRSFPLPGPKVPMSPWTPFKVVGFTQKSRVPVSGRPKEVLAIAVTRFNWEGPANEPWHPRLRAIQKRCRVIVARDVIRIAISGPPRHQVWGERPRDPNRRCEQYAEDSYANIDFPNVPLHESSFSH